MTATTVDEKIQLQEGTKKNTFKLPPLKASSELEKLTSEFGIRVKNHPSDMLENGEVPAIIFTVDAEERISHLTNKFWLTNVQEARSEKAQIMETFGEAAFFFFGERTKVYNFSGTTLETDSTLEQFSGKYLWSSSLVDFYDNHLRGTKLAENGEEALLLFRNMRLYGYITNFNVIHDAMAPQATQFSFSMIVRKHDFSRGTNGIRVLHDPSQYSSDPEDMAELSEEISVLSADLSNTKIEIAREAKLKAQEADDAPSMDRPVFLSKVRSYFNEHLDWMEYSNDYKVAGVGKEFVGDTANVHVKLDEIYIGSGTEAYLLNRKYMKDLITTYNSLIIDSQNNENELHT